MTPGALFGTCRSGDAFCTPSNVAVDTNKGQFRLTTASLSCTSDCSIAFSCGLGNLGTNVQCPCNSSGAQISCSCPRPASFMGAGSAPRCQLPDGSGPALAGDLAGTPCGATWDECVAARDPTQRDLIGVQGCVCLPDAASNLTWNCGDLNGWFTLAAQ
jgi:hypothetical protein